MFLLGAAVTWTAGALITSAADQPIVPLVVAQHLVGAPLLLAAALVIEPAPEITAKLSWAGRGRTLGHSARASRDRAPIGTDSAQSRHRLV